MRFDIKELLCRIRSCHFHYRALLENHLLEFFPAHLVYKIAHPIPCHVLTVAMSVKEPDCCHACCKDPVFGCKVFKQMPYERGSSQAATEINLESSDRFTTTPITITTIFSRGFFDCRHKSNVCHPDQTVVIAA